MACGHNCGRDARAPRVALPLQKMSNLQSPGFSRNSGVSFRLKAGLRTRAAPF